MSKLFLASASIRRKELLAQIGVPFQSASMDIDETVIANERPNEYVLRLAKEKARAGIEVNQDSIVLAADTTVVVAGTILGKPASEQEAYAMLKQLSGTKHEVLTGIAMAKQANGQLMLDAEVITTSVTFSVLTDQQIESYIKTGEPMGKAGAYGIQGKAALFVQHLEGSYSNVVGLPLAETGRMLEYYGIPVWS